MIDAQSDQAVPRRDWYRVHEIARATGLSRRTALDRLASVSSSLVRQERTGSRGRPSLAYHYSSLPELEALHVAPPPQAAPTAQDAPAQPSGISPDDLARGKLRALAVREYDARRRLLSASEAALVTARDWARRPREERVRLDERLAANKIRRHNTTVTIGAFSPKTLRRWSALLKEGGLPALCDARKGAAGRHAIGIDPEHLRFVHSLAISSAEADVMKALEVARHACPEIPALSLRTWQRRIRDYDPSGALSTLGKLGVAAFRRDHSPDIESDYSTMSYNAYWQLDDVTEDYYHHSALDAERILRPYAYMIMRVATRQWICGVTTETPIIQDQVRSMLGLAMATNSGGVPDNITFERGAIACDDYLEDLLSTLGIGVHRTSMDGGRVSQNATPDRAVGHPQAKGAVESGMRGHHRILWQAPGWTGPDERNTAHANLENVKAASIARAKALKDAAQEAAANGRQLILLTAAQSRAAVFAALEKHNNSPHGSLPRKVDPNTGDIRNMTPNEYALHLSDQSIRVMDERLLPLFFRRGYQVEVTKNGFRLHNVSYGRFDEDLQKLAGVQVMAYALPEHPEVAYVAELGRCVERYVAPAYGAAHDLNHRKAAIERSTRNRYEALVDEALAAPTPITLETTRFTRDPAPARPASYVAPEALLQRVSAISAGVARWDRDRAARADRFSSPTNPDPDAPRRGGGLIARSNDLREQAAMLAGAGS